MNWPFCGSRMANCRQWHPGKRVVYLMMYWDVVIVAIQLKARNNGDIWKVTCSQLVVCQTCSRTPQEPREIPGQAQLERQAQIMLQLRCKSGWDHHMLGFQSHRMCMGQAEGLVSQLRKWFRSVGAKDARLNKAQRPWQPTFQRGDGAGFLSSPDWLPKSFIPNRAQTTIIALKIENASLNPQTISVQTKK